VKHWIIMLKPDTYATAKEHGLIGVLHQNRRRFAALSLGDRFIAYVSRERVLDSHGVIESAPFEEVSNVPAGWEFYTQRARVRFEDAGAGIDGKEVLWGLSVCQEGINTSPSNLLFCKGGFMEIPENDYEWLRAVLRGDAPATAKRDV